MAESTIVEQEALDLLAKEAPFDPEKVQVVARSSSRAAAVGSGAGTATAVDNRHPATTINPRILAIAFLFFFGKKVYNPGYQESYTRFLNKQSKGSNHKDA